MFWIDVFFVLALVITLLVVVLYQDRLPEQDAAVVVPIPPNATCLADPEAEPLPVYDPYPEPGDKVGTVTLESLDLSWPIFEGTDEAQLSLRWGITSAQFFPAFEITRSCQGTEALSLRDWANSRRATEF